MNQILYTYNQLNYQNKKKFFKKRKTFYFYSFLFFICIVFIIFFYIIYNKYIIYKKSSDSNNMLNAYNMSTLYSSQDDYHAIQLSNDIAIIGLIEIPKINISYPILSQSNNELLKISVCRFARSSS